MLVSTSFLITTVNANPNIWLEVDGSFEGQAYVEMSWTLTVHEGTPPYRYGGSFGDGPSAWATLPTYENPYVINHTYTEEGEYTWHVSVRDADGDRDEVIETVTIGPPPFTVEIIPPPVDEFWASVPYQWDCNVIGGTPPYSYDWDFGDGTPHEDVKNPIHTWAEPSLLWPYYYTVYLEVYDSEPSHINEPPATDELNVEVIGYDLTVQVWSRLGFAFAGTWIKFVITASWLDSNSNVDCDSYDIDWRWVQDSNNVTHASGTIHGDELGEGHESNEHTQWVQAPHIDLFGTCTFYATICSDHDYNPNNNDDSKTILIL